MTALETMQEEEDKILTPLFLITDPWLWALMLYKKQFLRHAEDTLCYLEN